MPEHVILFAGPMGAGKTTAIRSLSEIEVVSTEAANSDREAADKATTTVALDYGEIGLGPDDTVRLYGVPGQSRFDFMWAILQERAIGLVLLVSAEAADPEREVGEQLAAFAELTRRGGVVVGVTHFEQPADGVGERIVAAVNAALPDRTAAVFGVDARDAQQMQMLLMSLIADVETRAMLAAAVEEPIAAPAAQPVAEAVS